MDLCRELYRPSLALLTDLYQLTMACAYVRSDTARKEATFHLFFREAPFGGGYAVACGLADVITFLRDFRFSRDDLDYLATLTGGDGGALFDRDFLSYLERLELTCDIDAVPEGSVVFAHEPLLRVTGPIVECQLLETALLNLVNFSTLVATKAARVVHAAGSDPVLEFGLRRAQGIDGALSAARAAYIGGCAATSNVLAGRLHGIPVRGTHAHSWVMSFDGELESFLAYAEAQPNNCIFLVDTYDTLAGVANAIIAGQRLRELGHEMLGIRLDSGDLSDLSVAARKLLDDAGFERARIVASNDLDELSIERLKRGGAAIAMWGVGTKLVTSYDQPALGGVYKLGAVREPGGPWQYRIKLSEDRLKVSIPGLQQVRRFRRDDTLVGDVIYDIELGIEGGDAHSPAEATRGFPIPTGQESDDLLIPIVRGGKLVYESPPLDEIRRHAAAARAALPSAAARLHDHTPYPVGLEPRLHARREELIAAARAAREERKSP